MKLFPLLALVVLGLAPCGAWASPASEEADIANSLARQGCYDTAVMFYEKALRLNPGFGPAIAGRAAALRKLAHPGSATPKAAKGKKPRPNEDRAAETAARAKTLAAEAAVRAQAQEANAAKRAAQVAAAAAKPKPVAATAPAKPKQAKQAAFATTKPKPIAAVTPPKPKPIAAVSAPKAKPVAAVTALNQSPIAALTTPKPTSKPVAVEAPKPKPIAAVAAIPTQSHTGAVSTPAKPLAAVAASKPVVESVAAPNDSTISSTRPAPRASVPHEYSSSSVAVPSNVGSSPPMSAMSDDAARSAASDKVPGWLIGMAIGTFLLLIVLAIWWLSPTLSASRQLHDRLKGLERTREER